MPVRQVHVRRARTRDVADIRRLVDTYTVDRRVLSKSTVNLFEDVQEFWVAEAEVVADMPPGEPEPSAPHAPEPEAELRVVGCGALHVLWEDLAEVRTVAVDPSLRGFGVGHRIVTELLDTPVRWVCVVCSV